MNSGETSTLQTYRLIITRRSAAELLVVPRGSGWALPEVAVRPDQRLAEQLTARTRESRQLETYCLFVPGLANTREAAPETGYAVMESLLQNGKAPADTFWMLSRVALRKGTLESHERAIVQSSLEEMERYTAEPNRGPFGRPDWVKELFQWIQEHIGPLGLRVTGAFNQLNGSTAFSLMRIETSGPAVWFKATGEPNRHELPVSVTLARLFPRFVPALLGVHSAWNGWLSREAPGATLDNFGDVSAWARTARTLAELQIASVGKSDDLLDSGCKDLRMQRLIGEIDLFVASMSESMAMQKTEPPAVLTNSELRILGEELKEACSALEGFGLPDTLGHIDFNPGNILVSPEACFFLDWAEACVANPFITFAYLREHSERQHLEGAGAVETMTAAYLEPWCAFFSSRDLERGMTFSSLVAVFAYAVSGNAWRSRAASRNPALAPYLRSLTRRMHRDAAGIRGRSEPCLR
jgi:hypothetical protein